MDVSVLAKLKTESLQTLRKNIDEVLAARLDDRIVPGREATFKCSRAGIVHRCRIDRILIKNIMVTEISPNAGTKWRISPNVLKVVPVERKAALPLKAPVVKHVPQSTGGGW